MYKLIGLIETHIFKIKIKSDEDNNTISSN